MLVSAAASTSPTIAPATSAPLNYVTTGDLLTYISAGAIAIVIAVAIGIALVLRKR